MTDIIDLNERRNEREQPDAEFVRKDDFGRTMYLFTLTYAMDGATWGSEVWAYSSEDAHNRVAAMRESLTYQGQLYSVIPA